ncbi:MAG: hypothetical protein AAFP07_17835, partial [Cyanobacteria bacterium J06606_4]
HADAASGVLMEKLHSFLLPALLGLVAGFSHGLVTHYMELPNSLGDPLMQPFQMGQGLRE